MQYDGEWESEWVYWNQIAGPRLTNNSSTERDTKAEKPKADKPKADGGAAKKPEDDDDDEPKPKYESKPGDKADVNDYKNKREANPGKDGKSKTTEEGSLQRFSKTI